jgi:glutathione S-transferase
MLLYHQPRSRSTRVLWLAEEAGAPVDVTLLTREHKQTDEYRKLHPLANSPVLVDADGPVFESAALVLHLADLHPEAGLIAPPGSHERALQYQWAFFGMVELEGPLIEVARQLWKDSGEPLAEIMDAALARFRRAAAVVEATLAGADHLVGDGFSVADIIVGSVLSFARTAEITELPPGLLAYVDGLEARPARVRASTRTA